VDSGPIVRDPKARALMQVQIFGALATVQMFVASLTLVEQVLLCLVDGQPTGRTPKILVNAL
jgi:hypothetical protein